MTPIEAIAIPDDLGTLGQELRALASRVEKLMLRPPAARPAPETAAAMLASPRELASKVREVLADRRRRRDFFPAELLGEPGWDVLLDLTIARLERVQVTTTSLCEAAAVPHSTALRWIHGMEKMGLIVRRHDPLDARRWLVELTDAGWERMVAYIRNSRILGR